MGCPNFSEPKSLKRSFRVGEKKQGKCGKFSQMLRLMPPFPFLLVSTMRMRSENSQNSKVFFACLKTSGLCLFLVLQNFTRGLGKSPSINMELQVNKIFPQKCKRSSEKKVEALKNVFMSKNLNFHLSTLIILLG